MRGRWRTFSLLLMLLGGCASRTSDVWTKPGVTDSDRQRDQRECLAQAVDPSEPLGGPLGNVVHLDRGLYEACMAQRGYTLSNERE